MDGKRQQEWDEEGERESETKEKNEKKKDNETWLAPVLTAGLECGVIHFTINLFHTSMELDGEESGLRWKSH